MIRALSLLLLSLSVFIVGCSRDPVVQVTGSVIQKGAVVKPGQGVDVQVVFVGTDKKGQPQSFTGSVEPKSGIFTVNNEGGIPPGSYKVLVNHTSTKGNVNMLGGPSASNKTPLMVTIPAQPRQEVIIDVDKKTIELKA